jgi:molybdopterin-binding protein
MALKSGWTRSGGPIAQCISAVALAGQRDDHVKVALDGDQLVTAVITKDGAEELDLSEGDPVTVLIESTEVMLAVE